MSQPRVLGHEKIRAILARALERDRLPPSLLLAGPDGVGKKTLAFLLAQSILCERSPVAEPCESCRTCRRVGQALDPAKLDALRRQADRHPDEDVWRNFRIHPDLVLAEGWRLTRTGRPRSDPEIRVDQVRELIGEISGAPFEARRRVFLIDDAHTMNEAAQNALLKSLEEPPPRSHVILISSAPLALRQTIRSRCQLVRFGPLSRGTVERVLVERLSVPPEDAHLRSGLAGGSLGVAMALESDLYKTTRETVLGVLETLHGKDALERMEAAAELERVEDPVLVLTVLRSLLRDVVAARAGASGSTFVNGDAAERVSALARGPLGPRAVAFAERAAATRFSVRGFANRPLAFETLVDELAAE